MILKTALMHKLKYIAGVKINHKSLPLWMPILLCVVSLIFLPNMGGGALSLPYSLLTWCVILLIITWGCAQIWVTQKIIVSDSLILLLFAVVLLSLPWLWTPSLELKMAALPRLLAIWLSLATLIALFQGQMSLKLERAILNWLLIAAVLQALLGVMQIFVPDWVNFIMQYDPLKSGWRPYGIFQQVNLLGSFLATGIGITLYLIITIPNPQFGLITPVGKARPLDIVQPYLYSVALVILWAVCLWNQSRIGLLGALLMTGVALASRFTIKIWLPTLLGILLGGYLPYTPIWPGLAHGVIGLDLVHDGSNFERLNLVIGTLQLIKQHPWLGNGLASFETQWFIPHLPTEFTSTSFTHPHNEILYVWSEGGIIALFGLLLIIAIWLSSIAKWTMQRGSFNFRICLLRILLPLPIALHLMTEYPLYQSIPHLLVLLLLWRIVWNEGCLRAYQPKGLLRKLMTGFSVLLIIAACAGIICCFGGLYVQHQLTRLEENGLQSVKLVRTLERLPRFLTWTQQQRLEYDSKTQSLLEFNVTGNKQNLLNYVAWGEKYLMIRNDANVSAAMLLSQQLLGNFAIAELIRAQAALHFPFDKRFATK